MRCMTLAEEMARQGAAVCFVGRLSSDMVSRLTQSGKQVLIIPDHVSLVDDMAYCRSILTSCTYDWLVVDHYHLAYDWESALRSIAKRIAVIDDLANRRHDADLLIDQTFGQDGSRYADLLPHHCRGLYGVRFALLRPEFALVRARLNHHIPDMANPVIHMFFGTFDPMGYSYKYAGLILKNFDQCTVRIAVGSQYAWMNNLADLAAQYPGRLIWNQYVQDMAGDMALCNIAFGAPGMATWERACLGLPAAYIATSENQIPILKLLADSGFCTFLGDGVNLADTNFVEYFKLFLADLPRLHNMRELGMSAVDGLGSRRIVDVMLEHI